MAPYRFTEWCLRGEPIQLFGDGSQSRDFTYVGDIANGTVQALEHNLEGFNIINLGGGGDRVTILELIELIGQLSGKEPIIDFKPAVQADMQHTSASIDKAQRLLNWTPQTTVGSGMKRLVNWHLENRQFLSEVNF